MESLKDVLGANPNGIVFAADEISGWAKSPGQYKGGRGDDRQLWLSIHSTMQLVCNRKGYDEPIVIDEPFVAVMGGIQPDALPDLIDSSREDGFSARILFSWPDPIPQGDWCETTPKQSTAYGDICEELWALEPRSEPHKFSEPAKQRWISWVNGHRAEIPGLPDNLRPTWSKAEGHCLRLTLILHLARQRCNETKSDLIDLPSIEGGVKLIEYFKSHARRVYGQLAITTGNDRIPKALRWIRKHNGQVTARLAQMNGFVKDPAEAVQLFEYLQELGHGTITHGKQGSIKFTLNSGKGV